MPGSGRQSNLTLDALILKEVVEGKSRALRVPALPVPVRRPAYLGVVHAG